jgi:hypothetical protein
MDHRRPPSESERNAAKLRARLDEIDAALARVRTRAERLRALEHGEGGVHARAYGRADVASPGGDGGPARANRARRRLALAGLGAGATVVALAVTPPHPPPDPHPVGQGGASRAPSEGRDGPRAEGPREGPAELASQRELARVHTEYDQALRRIEIRPTVPTVDRSGERARLEQMVKREMGKAQGNSAPKPRRGGRPGPGGGLSAGRRGAG